MAVNREKHIIDRDRQEVSDLYLKGYSTRQIATKISEKYAPYSISYVTVSKDIKWILKEWLKHTVTDIDQLKARELEKLNKLEQTYWEAWEKSIEDYEKKSKKFKGEVGVGKDGKPKQPTEQEIATTEMISMGNPAYLAGIERCIDRRCKILGVDAPVKTDLTTKGESIKMVTAIEVVHVSKDDIDARNQDASDPSLSQDKGGLQYKTI